MSEMQQLWEDSHKYYSPKKGWKNRMVRSDRASQKESSVFFGKCNISYSYFQLKSSGSIKISENFSELENKRRAYSRNKKM